MRDGYAVLVTDAAEVADVLGDLGGDSAPRPSGPARPGDDLDELTARVHASLPVRRGVPVERLAVAGGLAPAEVAAGLGRLELLGLAERHGEGWRQRRQ
jgi:DNA processing protein